MFLKLILHTEGPAPKTLPHIPSNHSLPSTQPCEICSPAPLAHLLHSSTAAGALSLSLMPLLPAALLVAVQCCLLQDIPWPRTEMTLPGLSQYAVYSSCLCTYQVAQRGLPACPPPPLNTESLLWGRNFPCLPSSQ